MLSFVKGGIIKVWTYKISQRYVRSAPTGLSSKRGNNAGNALIADGEINRVVLPSEKPRKRRGDNDTHDICTGEEIHGV